MTRSGEATKAWVAGLASFRPEQRCEPIIQLAADLLLTSEVSVVRSNDRVLLALLDVLSVPLTDTGSTGVGEDDTSDVFERLNETVSVNGGSDLLGSGGDSELRLALQAVGLGLLGDGGGSRHVLVRRVGAGTDQSDLELLRPAVVLDGLGELGDRGGQIGGEGTVDVRLEFAQVQVDDLVVLGVLVGSQVVLEGFSVLGDVASLSSLEVAAHSLVVREDGGRGTDFGTHVTDGGHTGTRQRLNTGTVVFDDGTSSTLDGQGSGNAKDDILGGSPSVHLSVQVDTDNLGALELPRNVGHNVDSVGTTDTTGDHTQTTGVGGMRVSTDHHQTGNGVVLQDDLVDNTGSRLPESDSVLGATGGQEVVDFLVDVDGSCQILVTTDLGLNQVVTVDGSGDGGGGQAGGHELQESHLEGERFRTRFQPARSTKFTWAVASWQATRSGLSFK